MIWGLWVGGRGFGGPLPSSREPPIILFSICVFNFTIWGKNLGLLLDRGLGVGERERERSYFKGGYQHFLIHQFV
jgi:hypothetical protein